VQIHVGDAYQTEWGNERDAFYGVVGTPTVWFDGMLSCFGAQPTVGQQYQWYREQYLARRAAPTDVTIELAGEWIGPRAYEASATVCREEGGDPSPKEMLVQIVEVLDFWPEPGSDNRNAFRQAASPKVVALEPGECRVVKGAFVFDDESWAHRPNIRLVAWAQEPNETGPAEVLQAAVRAWPLPSCRLGTVDLAVSATPAQVLTINGSAGEGHVVEIPIGEAVEVQIQPSPSGPDPGRFALYAWLGEPDPSDPVPQPQQLGTMCFPSPLSGGVPQPKRVWNNIGKSSRLGEPDYPSSPAPSVVFRKTTGFGTPLTATFQGFLLDAGSIADVPASVTNAVVLDVR
jgi:hypothetical protein